MDWPNWGGSNTYRYATVPPTRIEPRGSTFVFQQHPVRLLVWLNQSGANPSVAKLLGRTPCPSRAGTEAEPKQNQVETFPFGWGEKVGEGVPKLIFKSPWRTFPNE